MDEQQEIEAFSQQLKARQRYPRGPVRAGETLKQLMARRGYAQTQSGEQTRAAWRRACGEVLAKHTRVGTLSRGVLTVFVRNSMVLQELTFPEQQLLERLQEIDPDLNVRALRLRIAAVD